MSNTMTMVDRISRTYPTLSGQLQKAANFAVENPIDIATRSLRSVAATSGVSPATYSRLARALGYVDYEEMREEGRATMDRRLTSFSERAASLHDENQSSNAKAALQSQASACISNIERLVHEANDERLTLVADILHGARKVLIVGSLGSSGFTDYFSYLTQWFSDKWQVAGRNGTTLAASLAPLNDKDVVLAISKAPDARRTVTALRAAYDKRVPTVLITDSHTSPALAYADHYFIVSSDSPSFFSSYTATLVLIETLVTLVLKRAGPSARERIAETETQIRALGESWETE